jgi:hypothetical protein
MWKTTASALRVNGVISIDPVALGSSPDNVAIAFALR